MLRLSALVILIVGYQGWFGCDKHWFTGDQITVDFWPELDEYPEEALCDSAGAYDSKYAVDTHFRWMSEYGIDAAEVQRFVGNPTDILPEVVEAAEKYDIKFYVQYDGLKYEGWDSHDVVRDWEQISYIIESPQYMHIDGKPAISLFGVGFDNYSDQTSLIEYFENKGFTVIVGVPGEPADYPYDYVKPWFVGRYTNEEEFDRYIEQWGDIIPVAWPGFSWHNLAEAEGFDGSWDVERDPEFFAYQLEGMRDYEYVYIAMFDEVDEGTAIYKTEEDPPYGLYEGQGDEFLEVIRRFKDAYKSGELLHKPFNDHIYRN